MSAIDVDPNGTAPTERTPPEPVPPVTPRARLVSVTVQLNVVADDGVTLHPLQVAPVQVAAGEWAGFTIEPQVADVQRQLDEQMRR